MHNASGDRATVGLSVAIVDHAGHVSAQFDGDPVDMVDGEKSVMSATGALKDARFWSPEDPYLYDVYTILKVDGKVVDVNRIETGFRKTEFKGGVGTGGVYINDKFVYLKGFAERSADEWAGVGAGYPDWMHDYTASMIRECHGNYMRWMHISPQKVDADSFARFGIIQVCPAGDKEARRLRPPVGPARRGHAQLHHLLPQQPQHPLLGGRQHRRHPRQMTQMVELRKQWDPDGGRVMGAAATTTCDQYRRHPIEEYYGVMIGQDTRCRRPDAPTGHVPRLLRRRRDRAPLVEAEDFRDEGARRFWDDYSPPYYKAKKGPNDTWKRDGFLYTSESFALDGVKRYWEYWKNRISNTDPAHSRWSGYCSIYFTDEDADGRQDSSEVCARQRQGRRHAPAQGDLLRLSRHPERDSPTCTSSATGPTPPPSPTARRLRRPSTSSPIPSRSS